MSNAYDKSRVIAELSEAQALITRTIAAVIMDEPESTYFGSAVARVKNAEDLYDEMRG